MLSTFIAENYAIVRIVVVLAGIACVVLAGVLARAGAKGRRIALVIAGLATLVIILLTLTPHGKQLPAADCFLEVDDPLGDIFNVALFLLPALFIVVAVRKPVLVLLGGILFSAGIEVVQQLLRPVLSRACDINDWIANSTGAAAGVAIAVVVIAVVDRLAKRRGGASDARESDA